MISIKNVSKEYFGYSKVINDLSLHIDNDEKVFIFGKCGSGKTTLLKLIAGLEKPTQGEVIVDDKDISSIHPRDLDFSFVFEELYIPRFREVKRILARPLKLRKLDKQAVKAKVIEIADKFNITAQLDNPGVFLRPYDAVKVAFARGFIRDSRCIIIDNPLSKLNLNDRKDYYKQLFNHISSYKRSIIYATDSVDELKYTTGRIVFLEFGYIHQIGYYNELYNKPNSLAVAKALRDDIAFINAQLDYDYSIIIANNKYKLKDYYLDNITSEYGRMDVIIGVPIKDIKVSNKGTLTATINYIRADNAICVTSEITEEAFFATGMPDGNYLEIELDNIMIFDRASEKTLIKY